MRKTPSTYKKKNGKNLLLQTDRFGTHFNLFLSTPMMAENYWLENEHIEIDRLLHLLAVTFLLDFFRLCSLTPLSFCVLLFRDTDGLKRRFVVKINKKSINLLRVCFTCLLYYMIARQVRNKNKASSLPNNWRRRWEKDLETQQFEWREENSRLTNEMSVVANIIWIWTTRHFSVNDNNFSIEISVIDCNEFTRQASRLNHFPHYCSCFI